MKRVHIIVSGVVQGVGFRYYTKKEAESLELTGFVRNTADGSVEIEAQGTEGSLTSFIEWVKHGPVHASVESFHLIEMKILTQEKSFEIK